MSEKHDEVLVKPNKLDSIETTSSNLCSKMAIVESDMYISKLKADARGTGAKLQQMDDGLQSGPSPELAN